MNINVTLLIQAFHFGVAYALLRVFVFKPFLRLLEKQEKAKEALDALVAQEEHVYALQKEEKRSAFTQLKNQLLTRMPTFEEEAPVCEVSHLEHVDVHYELSQKEKEDIKKKALDLLR